MRHYTTSFDGDTVDLDDPKTYDHLPEDTHQLDDKMFCEIGKALCYMNNFHPNIFIKTRKRNIHDVELCGYQQRKRVMKLIETFCNERKNHYNDVLWLQEQVYIFQDEVENMC